MLRLALLLFLAGLTVSAQPVINPGGIVNAASYAISGLQNSDIAQGSIFAVFGSRLATGSDGISATKFPLPTSEGLAGTTVKIQVGALGTYDAPMLYVSAVQLVAIMPSAVPAGKTVYVTVRTSEGQSQPALLTVVPQSFGIFSANASGTGPGAIQNYVDGPLPENTLFSSARPGQAAIIWGTGLGPISGDDASQPAPTPFPAALAAQVFVAGQPATVTYQGRSGCCAGLDQINVQIPTNITGCYIPVVVKAGGVVSNTVTMSVSPNGGTCSDPLSYSDADLAAAQTGARIVTVGAINLKRVQSSGTAAADSGIGWFGTNTSNRIRFSRGLFAVPSVGACTVDQFRGSAFQPSEDAIPQLPLNAGSALAITSSSTGEVRQIPKFGDIYSGSLGGGGLTPFLNPGSFGIVPVPGQPLPQILTFNAPLDVPSGVAWTNPPASISRAQDLTITWTGGNPEMDYVQITGYSTVAAGGIGVGFVCSAPVSSGSFRVPAVVLAALPAGTGKMQVGSASLPSTHRIPSPNSSLNALYLGYNISESRSVNYQ